MLLRRWTYIASLLLMLCACEHKEMCDHLAATIAEDITPMTTKTHIHPYNPVQVVWTSADSICVWNTHKMQPFQITNGGTTTGVFKGEAIQEPTVALYPYQADATSDGRYVSYTIPTRQKAVQDGFDPKAGIMAGRIVRGNVLFQHQVAYLRVKTPANAETIRTIRITTNDGVELTTGSDYVELYADSTFASESAYYMAIQPGTYTKGITLTYILRDGTERTKRGSNTLSVTTGHYITIPDLHTDN